jgi:hypothetical protein
MSARVLVLLVAIGVSSAARAIQPDPIYRETVIRHSRPRIASEKFDPQESDPKLRAAFAAADAAAERRVGNVKRDDHFAFRFWAAKKKILREQYGIDWKAPAELNPQITYASYGQRQITQRETHEITPVVRRRTSKPITSIERDYQGKVRVWTRGIGDESIAYVMRIERGRWKIVDVERWLP